MDKLFLQLSKLGDVINILPIAYAAHLRGEKVGIMSCTEFADVLDGVSYVEKVVFSGRPWEINKAVEEAKKICANVVSTMVNGPIEEIAKHSYGFDLSKIKPGEKFWLGKTDSFCRESWKLAGCLPDWGKVPLVFDRRSRVREGEWMPLRPPKKNKKPIIIVSAGSVSSPFPYRELLLELVNLKYGKDFNVIDLATIKAEKFYDLLGLYEVAHCLISVDTAHLHLAAAVPSLPVMALVQDRYSLPLAPEMKEMAGYWSGTAWRPSHHFHCRYRDFPRRALEMFTAIGNIGWQDASTLRQVYFGGVKQWNGFNYFPIQPGSCRRDAVNVLGDTEHFPMLQDVIRMFMQVVKPTEMVFLSREEVKIDQQKMPANLFRKNGPFFAYRMNRNKVGQDTFFPAVDMFAATVDFWVKIFPEIPDVVFGADAYWSRLLMEIFKKHGAVEVEGIYRDE